MWLSSAQKAGVLPLSQQSTLILGSLAYHDYEGVALNPDEKPRLQANLGRANYLMLRNHGLLTVGRTVGEAFNWMHRLELSCRAQLAAMACNTPLQEVPAAVLEETYMNYQPQTRRPYGLMEWPGLLRMVERMDPSFKD